MFHAEMRNDLEKGAPGVRKCGQVGLLWPIAVRSIPCVYAEIVDLEELLRKLISRGSPVQSGAPPTFLSGYAALPLGLCPAVLGLCYLLAAVDRGSPHFAQILQLLPQQIVQASFSAAVPAHETLKSIAKKRPSRRQISLICLDQDRIPPPWVVLNG